VTTTESSGVVDMSGAISSILKSYQDVLTSYQTMLTGDPDAIAAAGTKLTDQASSLSSVSSDVTQRAGTLAASWQGTAATAFHTAAGQLTTQVDGVGTSLR
jgi:uncharacterized protein YukE